MKKFVHVVLGTLLFASAIFAQEGPKSKRFTVFALVAQPTGDFASTTSSKAGDAVTGFGVGIDYSHPLDKNFSWFTTLSLSINSVDEAALTDQLEFELEESVQIDAGTYKSTYALTGLSAKTSISSTIDIYGFGQAGLVFGATPEATITILGGKATLDAASALSIAFGVGGGMVINDKINVGIRYATGEPQYEATISGPGGQFTNKYKQPTAIIQVVAGFSF